MFKILLISIVAIISGVVSAPRSHSSVTYDQKQTGDWNVRLTLKDFQIIAFLGKEFFGELGDYDYDYDFGDFTIKPSASSTASPNANQASSSPVSTTSKPFMLTTEKPAEKPAIPDKPSSEAPNKPLEITITNSEGAAKPDEKNVTEKKESAVKLEENKNSEKITKVNKLELDNNRAEISEMNNSSAKPDKETTDSISSVTEKESDSSTEKDQQDVTNAAKPQRRCINGQMRDKRGRCRRVRRPGSYVPLGFRLANLASKLRTAPSESSESIEDF